ncbi:hypothetical protein [Paenibacillus daejeonensis]|uniref:hypothetical protein n=1 Tax=Paenibacillus daejeonensis TaxID=135193 RepID=UPI000375FBD8|nr:hypothetical protein [Paenibacillus daejeonensis]
MINESELLKKLRYKDGRAAVVNAPEGYELTLADSSDLEGEYTFLQLYVNQATDITEWVPKVIPHLVEDALFWICYPKKRLGFKPDINRDSLWTLVNEISDYRPVSNVAIDESWSAIRLRHRDLVKSK